MTLNCSTNPTFIPLQIMHYSVDNNQFENDIPSDALDALADLTYEQRQAMMEELDEPFPIILQFNYEEPTTTQ